MKIECPACGSDDVEPIHASYSMYTCLVCGDIFDENEESSIESMENDSDWDDE